jgi:hypothetical protein
MNASEDCRFVSCADLPLQATGTSNGASALALVLSPRFRFGTLMLWLAYFMGLSIYYLFANWMPTLFKDSGLQAEKAALPTALFPLGGILGNLCFAWVMDRLTGHRVVVLTYLLIGALLLLVGFTTGYPIFLGTLIFLSGTAITSAAAVLMPLAASFYPTAARATGVAWIRCRQTGGRGGRISRWRNARIWVAAGGRLLPAGSTCDHGRDQPVPNASACATTRRGDAGSDNEGGRTVLAGAIGSCSRTMTRLLVH